MTLRTRRPWWWLKMLASLVVLTVALAAAGMFLFLRASLPQLDGEIRAPGLGGPVTATRDALGVPTVTARDRFDLAYGIGYLHAQDRFFQMDYLRRSGAGELAELVGPPALDVDRAHRLFRLRARAEATLARLPPDQRRLLDRYTQGVNDGLAALGARPFEYALLGARPMRWRPEDSLLAIWAMYFELQGNLLPRAIARHWLAMHASPSQAAFLLPVASAHDAPLDAPAIDLPAPPLPASAPDGFRAPVAADADAAPRLAELDIRSSIGSNNWVIAGARSANGAAIVGNDMHLGIALPNTWYRAALVTDDGVRPARRVTGVTLAGVPAVVVGSNGEVAWGFTDGYIDGLDLVPVEQDGGNPLALRVGGRHETARRYDEAIRVHGAASVTLPVTETSLGPLREIGGRWYAIHWIAQVPGAVNLELARMADARDLGDALRVANEAGIPAENVVVGDRAGHIGWSIAGPLPDRRAAAAAADGAAWQAVLPPEAVPRVVDPAAGQLWSANNRQLAGAAYRLIGDGGADNGARATQLRDDLAALGRTDERAAYRVDLDDRARFIAPWRERALGVLDDAALAGHPQRAAFRRLLMQRWDGRASVASVGYRLARGFLYTLADDVFGGLNAQLGRDDAEAAYPLANPRWAVVLERLLDAQPAGWLPAGAASWRDLQLGAIDRTIAELTRDGTPLDQATWGRRNTLRIAHPFAASVPLFGRWLSAPADEVPGDAGMPRVAGPNFGQSERMVVAPGHESQGIFNMPGGQSGHPLSAFFLAGHEAWVKGEAQPFLPGQTRHTLRFVP
ncbi:penicillin acylase family protein [Burkholderia glumae]|uniref:penicillin acylase family protein n=1 Tax=Burkholderia glumae TaxID=337 RepID=UPI000C271831|nr:penicillin acylase family protein [Burkholderia glumae]PJO22357.1 penicillin acylase family protein [Burkholderia glumae AU6208]QHE09385.1 penicillin acylase family protein [Burkholderia glumae AU6208]